MSKNNQNIEEGFKEILKNEKDEKMEEKMYIKYLDENEELKKLEENWFELEKVKEPKTHKTLESLMNDELLGKLVLYTTAMFPNDILKTETTIGKITKTMKSRLINCDLHVPHKLLKNNITRYYDLCIATVPGFIFAMKAFMQDGYGFKQIHFITDNGCVIGVRYEVIGVKTIGTDPEKLNKVVQVLSDIKKRKCGKCGKEDSTMLCSRCKKKYYCSKNCQVSDWETHKLNCLIKKN